MPGKTGPAETHGDTPLLIQKNDGLLSGWNPPLVIRAPVAHVNHIMVNGDVSPAFLANFREIFPFWGRFLRFGNPVKYRRNFNINHDLVHLAPASAVQHYQFTQAKQ
jgi:hypothetical protein